MKRVVVLQKSLTHYRSPLFNHLRTQAHDRGIDLDLVYGDGTSSERLKGDLVDLQWGTKVPNTLIRTRWGEAVWQPVLPHLRGADLVVVEQANKLLLNYVLQARRILGAPRLAFWGHGRNFQGENRVQEALKRHLATRVDWWFAYNQRSVELVQKYGFPPERITDVRNSVDTRQLRKDFESLGPSDAERAKQDLGTASANICVYCGGLYADKKLEFLVQSADRIRRRVDDFVLVVIGDGDQRTFIEGAAHQRPWMRYLGPLFGAQKAAVFRLAKLQLMPGLVGLGILDSFAVGVPLITTNVPVHSPEIDYLVPGQNGDMTDHDTDAYAQRVIDLLKDDLQLQALRQGAWDAAVHYTVEAMAERFAVGLGEALRS